MEFTLKKSIWKGWIGFFTALKRTLIEHWPWCTQWPPCFYQVPNKVAGWVGVACRDTMTACFGCSHFPFCCFWIIAGTLIQMWPTMLLVYYQYLKGYNWYLLGIFLSCFFFFFLCCVWRDRCFCQCNNVNVAVNNANYLIFGPLLDPTMSPYCDITKPPDVIL